MYFSATQIVAAAWTQDNEPVPGKYVVAGYAEASKDMKDIKVFMIIDTDNEENEKNGIPTGKQFLEDAMKVDGTVTNLTNYSETVRTNAFNKTVSRVVNKGGTVTESALLNKREYSDTNHNWIEYIGASGYIYIQDIKNINNGQFDDSQKTKLETVDALKTPAGFSLGGENGKTIFDAIEKWASGK